MTYKYTRSSLAAAAKKGVDPKQQYVELFQKTLDEQFYNSSNWWTIQEETASGSGVFSEIDVRISHVINAETGLKLGDDWKTIFFKEIDHNIELGKKYVFDNNTWITVNTEFLKNLTGTCTIRRCNNTLRWIDESTGMYYTEPCIIDYRVKEPRNYSTSGSPFLTPGGFIHIEAQFNTHTNFIKENQRFLFGNKEHWTGYKVIGTGVNDFRNQFTYDNESSKILTLDLVADYVNNQLDDVINGIADVYSNNYSISLNMQSASGDIGENIQLEAYVLYNNKSVDREIEWTSSNDSIASVNSSGLVTFNEIGMCSVKAKIKNNPTEATCSIVVSSTPVVNSYVSISPEVNYILEGTARTYAVYLYNNNIQQSDTFTITLNQNNVPSKNFVFTQIDGNHFSIENKIKDVSSYLTVQCVSGTNTKSFNIQLKGAW